MKDAIDPYKKGDLTVRIMYDTDPQSPRDTHCSIGTICYWNGSRDTLGDEPKSREELLEIDKVIERGDILGLPVFVYRHGNVILNTTGFTCKWDSGRCGVITTTKDKIRATYGVSRVTARVREQALAEMKREIAIYSAYLNEEVYGYGIENEEGVVLDSC